MRHILVNNKHKTYICHCKYKKNIRQIFITDT